MENEIWKPVVWFEWLYEVSNLWRIKSFKTWRYWLWIWKIIKWTKHPKWYRRITFLNKPYLVHRIVAQAFIPNPENKKTINHINCIKNDNRVYNLEWATDKENIRHAWDNWLKENTRIQSSKGMKLYWSKRLNKIWII